MKKLMIIMTAAVIIMIASCGTEQNSGTKEKYTAEDRFAGRANFVISRYLPDYYPDSLGNGYIFNSLEYWEESVEDEEKDARIVRADVGVRLGPGVTGEYVRCVFLVSDNEGYMNIFARSWNDSFAIEYSPVMELWYIFLGDFSYMAVSENTIDQVIANTIKDEYLSSGDSNDTRDKSILGMEESN